MMTLIAAAVLAGTPVTDDVVATWVRDDGQMRVSISLDTDGRCAIVSTRLWNGATYKSSCGYTMNGSTVQIRAGDAATRREFSLVLDRRTDEMKLDGNEDARFYRTRLEKRAD